MRVIATMSMADPATSRPTMTNGRRDSRSSCTLAPSSRIKISTPATSSSGSIGRRGASVAARAPSAVNKLFTAAPPAPMPDNDCDDCECLTKRPGWGCLLITAVVAVLLFAFSWDVLEPTEWGIVQNGLTGYVELDPDQVYEGGRYFIWLRHSFIKFPRNLVNLEFSDFGGEADENPIAARTGPDPDDKESGGQPIRLSVAFQYAIDRRDVPRIYQTFGPLHKASYLRFAKQAITNEAQQFTPRAFWLQRAQVERLLRASVNETLFKQGYASVHDLQLMRVDFNSNYEDTITNIQLQEQLKVTKSYQLNVTRVLKEVDILASETQATIARINAQAQREANVIVNSAAAQAIQLEQSTKALWYARLKESLRWSNDDFLKYVKIKSLGAQKEDHMVVGVEAIAG